jgi:phosphatidate cytidylyltransferase
MTTLIMLASFGLITHRDTFGLTWMLWLVLVVAVTDIGGYFAGRIIGGPKFWPRVSPKKTWSGTAAGWVGAGIVGWAFMATTGMGVALIGISVALSMASQMGDIAESAVKRSAGVKDSSHLLPGHGGVWDRFDGMLGASLLLLVIESFTGFPSVST